MSERRANFHRSHFHDEWHHRKCARCGYARINVRHNVTPESQAPEGRAYYADMTDLHEFVPAALAGEPQP